MCEFVVIMPGILSDIFRGKVPFVPVVKIWTIFLIDLYQLLFQRDLSRALDPSWLIGQVTKHLIVFLENNGFHLHILFLEVLF